MKVHINYLPEVAQRRMMELYTEMVHAINGKEPNEKVFRMICARMDKTLTRDGRLAFFRWIFNDPIIESGKDLSPSQQRKVIFWADSAEAGGEWAYGEQFITDLEIIRTAIFGAKKNSTPVKCSMCEKGKIEKVIRHRDYPNDLSKAKFETVTCRCCQGNYKNCAMCSALGGV